MPKRFGLLALLGMAASSIGLASTPPPAAAGGGLADIPIAIADGVLFDERHNDGRQGQRGTWTLQRGRLADGRIRLRFELRPPKQSLPVRSGPAVLFAGLSLVGDAGGDMGAGVSLRTLVRKVIPACDDADCRYAVDVDLPTNAIRDGLARLASEHATLEWLSVHLTLVRTFGQGQWLQVMPFLMDGDGSVEAVVGVLGAMHRASGTLFPFGLFPADLATPLKAGDWSLTDPLDYGFVVEQLRRGVDDPSLPLRTANASLRITIEPSCEHAAHLTLHDDGGDRFFDAGASNQRAIDGQAIVPVGVTLRLTLQDGGGIDFDQGRMGWGVRIGAIVSDGSPLDIVARFSCDGPTGTIVSTAALATVAPSPTSVASAPSDAAPSFASSVAESTQPAQVPTDSTAAAGRSLGVVLVVLAAILIVVAAAVFRARARRRAV